jgi:hypothetical protein
MNGILSSRSCFSGTFNRCLTASLSGEVGATDTWEQSLRLVIFEEAKGEEREAMGGGGGR